MIWEYSEKANGAKQYTYNTANMLVKVETYDGSQWEPQAEMEYDGMGHRLGMTAYASGTSVTTQYVFDYDRTLSATSGTDTTFYLYGVGGVIGELTDTWTYGLQDGSNTQRQLTDEVGAVTLASSYTPWGDILSVQGDGSFTFGYFGSMMDAATGLLYIGNGQYYDPATGRFINDGNQMNNLPVMVDPAGMFIAPLSLLPLMFSKKRKKRTKLELLLILLVVSASLGMSLTTLNNVTTSPSPSVVPVLPIENQSENPTVHLSDAALLGNPRSTDNPIDSPSIQCGDSIVYRADYTANDLINFANGTETEKTAEAEPGDIRYWKPKEMEQVLKHAWDVAYALQATLNRILYYYLGRSYVRVSAFEAWNLAFGGKVTFKRMGVLADTSGICVGENLIHMYDTKDTEDYDDDGKPIYSDSYVYFTKAGNRPRVIVHELGHNFRRVYFNRTGALNGGIDLYSKIPENFLRPWDYQWGGIFHQTTLLTGPVYKFGYTGSEKTADVAQFGHPNAIELRPAEEFADMFVGYVYGFDLTCIEYQEMNVYHKEGLNDKYGKAFNCNEGIEKAQFMQEEIGYILVKAYFGYKEK